MYKKACTKEISVTQFRWFQTSVVYLCLCSLPGAFFGERTFEEFRDSLSATKSLGEGWCSQCKCGAFFRLLSSCCCTVWNTWPGGSPCVVDILWVVLMIPMSRYSHPCVIPFLWGIFFPSCPLSFSLSLFISFSHFLESSLWGSQVIIMWVVALQGAPHNKELMSPAKAQWCPKSCQQVCEWTWK